MNFFILRDNHEVELNRPEILLVKEFEELFSLKFNQGEKGDTDGRKRRRAYKVMAFIYLVYDWKSPYAEYSLAEKVESALSDSELDSEFVKDPLVAKAIIKYLDLQDTRIVKLLKSSYRVVDEIRHHFDTVQLDERDPMTGKPIFTARDLMSNLAALGKTVESLKELEYLVKKEQEQNKGLRGDANPGMFD